MFKPIKFPSGPSAFGAAGVRALDRVGGDWQTKRSANTTSKRMGDFRRVTVEGDGWVSAGKIERNGFTGAQLVPRSWSVPGGTDGVKARQGLSEQTLLLLSSAQPGLLPENPVGYLGKGELHKLKFSGAFFGVGTQTALIDVLAAYYPQIPGKRLAQIPSNTIPDFVPGARTVDGWSLGVCHDLLQPDSSNAFYTAFLPDSMVVQSPLPAIAEPPRIPRVSRPNIHRISPTELYGFTPGLASTATTAFGSQFVYSSDNGANWFYIDDGSALLTDRDGFDAMDEYQWESDEQVLEIRDRLLVAPVADSSILVVVGEGAYTPILSGSHLRIYRLTTSVTLTASALSLGTGQHGTLYTRGGHHQGHPFMQVVDEANSVSKLVFIHPSGMSISVVPMPQVSHWTGRARALDQNTMQCVMYRTADGPRAAGYYIHTSDDFGATWEIYRQVLASATPPPEISVAGIKLNHSLLVFNDAVLPRKNGLPAPTYPGAPWIGDSGITPPWM